MLDKRNYSPWLLFEKKHYIIYHKVEQLAVTTIHLPFAGFYHTFPLFTTT